MNLIMNLTTYLNRLYHREYNTPFERLLPQLDMKCLARADGHAYVLQTCCTY
jgi:hypothetical protein